MCILVDKLFVVANVFAWYFEYSGYVEYVEAGWQIKEPAST